MTVPHRLEDRPLLGVLPDIALEPRGELTDAGTNIGVAVAGGHELERLFDPRHEESLLAPGEGREQSSAGPEREGHMRGGKKSRPSEELDSFADARDGAVREDPECAAAADDSMDPDRRVHRHEDEA